MCRLATLVLGLGLFVGLAFAEGRGDVEPVPLVTRSSPARAAQFRHWQFWFEAGEPHDAPENGIFPWLGNLRTGIARLVEDGNTPRRRLTPVAKRTRYVGADADRAPDDRVVTNELIDVLRRKDVAQRMGNDLPSVKLLDYEKDLSVALVQDFEAALRVRGQKERFWSIHWRIVHQTSMTFAGVEIWGLFTRENGVLKPFHLRASEASGEIAHDYVQVLAVGDLDRDGIDELTVRVREYEPEDDRFAILALERGVPVYVVESPIPSPRTP